LNEDKYQVEETKQFVTITVLCGLFVSGFESFIIARLPEPKEEMEVLANNSKVCNGSLQLQNQNKDKFDGTNVRTNKRLNEDNTK
jgi:hypothetical protein